jgi:hypothetical protein
MSTYEAEHSAMPYAFEIRRIVEPLCPEFSDLGQDAQGWYVSRRTGERQWRESNTGLVLELARSVTVADMVSLWFPKYLEGKRRGKPVKPTDVVSGEVELFTRTTKMGCYSFNMTAGPVDLGGSCPGARMAFDVRVRGEKKVKTDEQLAILAAREYAAVDLRDAVPARSEEARRRFLCNGCYALKGNYVVPNVALNQIIKHRWVTEHALPTGTFVGAMVKGIRRVQHNRRKARRPTTVYGLAAWTHPNFFRIHDSGDFFSAEYLYAWFEVCRKLPDIHFWAPTRVWTDPKMGKVLAEALRAGDVPENLAMRPSGLFFDGPQPRIRGLAGGTSSSNFQIVDTGDGEMEVRIEHCGKEAWACPAYLPTNAGGGAPALGKKVKKNAPWTSRQTMRRLTPLDKKVPVKPGESKVFYDGVLDVQGQFVLDPATGRPLSRQTIVAHWILDPATGQLLRLRERGERKTVIPESRIARAQAFQPSGCCTLALDPHGAKECRVCWGVSGGRRDPDLKVLPVVYAKH